MSSRFALLAGFLALLAVASFWPARSHEGATERHAALDEAIREEPGEGLLYLERALLQAEEGLWPAAFRDLERAEELGVRAQELARARARLYRGLGCHRWAHDTLLALGDQDADDLWLVERAELAELAGRDEHARADYERFLAHSTLVTPDHVLALADLLERMPGQGADAAIAVVEAARERLGAAPAFDARLQRLRNPVDTKETPTTDSIPTRADLR